MLLAMATGTGKTKLAIALLYRLLATKRFRRICFVVDRSALGDQAAGEFTTTKIVSGKAFADIFGLKECKFARNNDPLRGDFRFQLQPLLTCCVSILPFGPAGLGRTCGDDWRGPDRPDTSRLF
jgi:hypothetical protein